MEFYGQACTTLAKTPEEVSRMWVGDAVRLQAYWANHPPVHLLVAAYLGVKPKAPLSEEELGAMVGGIRVIEKDVATPPAGVPGKDESHG